MRNGLDANVESMTQAQKTLLRYQYVLANTTAAQGDFLKTQDTWANQVRILKQQFQALGIVIGKGLIYTLKPLVKAMNAALTEIIGFAENVLNALGHIFGWKIEFDMGGIVNDMGDYEDSIDGVIDGLDDATESAKEFKNQLMGFDNLNIISLPTVNNKNNDDDKNNTLGDDLAGGFQKLNSTLEKTDSLFESNIDDLEELGSYISDSLGRALESITWQDVYDKAKDFGTGLASFLNGLIKPKTFASVGKTLANTLNTVVAAALAFGEKFDWENLGVSVGTGINSFFENFDGGALKEALKVWGKGIGTAIYNALDGIKWETEVYPALKDVGSGIAGFLNGLITVKTFSSVASTLAKTLNSILYSIIQFEEDYDWENLGNSVGAGVNAFFDDFDFEALATAINGFVDGLKKALAAAIKRIEWLDVIKGAINFTGSLELDTVGIIIGGFALTKIIPSAIKSLATAATTAVETEFALAPLATTLTLGAAIVASISTFTIAKNLFAPAGEADYAEMIRHSFIDAAALGVASKNPYVAGVSLAVSLLMTGFRALIEWDNSVPGGALSEKIKEIKESILSTNVGERNSYSVENGEVVVSIPFKSVISEIKFEYQQAIHNLTQNAKDFISNPLEFLKKAFTTPFYAKESGIEIDSEFFSGSDKKSPNTGDSIFADLESGLEDVVKNINEWWDTNKPTLSKINANFDLTAAVKTARDNVQSWWANNKATLKDIATNFKDSVENGISTAKSNIETWWGKNKATLKDIATNFKDSVENAITAKDGVVETIKSKWETARKTFKLENVLMNFTGNVADAITGKNGLIDKIKSKWTTAKATFSLSDVALNFTGNVADAITGTSGLVDTIKSKWTTAKATFSLSGVALNFTSNVKTAITGKNGLIDKIKSVWNTAKNKFSFTGLKFKIKLPSLSVSYNTKGFGAKVWKALGFAGTPSISVRWKEWIPRFANGGFPNVGSLFVAGEAGAEMVGNINGKTGVASGKEITGIRDAINNTSNTQVELLRQQNSLLYAILQKETGISSNDIFSAVQDKAKAYKNRTGNPAFA